MALELDSQNLQQHLGKPNHKVCGNWPRIVRTQSTISGLSALFTQHPTQGQSHKMKSILQTSHIRWSLLAGLPQLLQAKYPIIPESFLLFTIKLSHPPSVFESLLNASDDGWLPGKNKYPLFVFCFFFLFFSLRLSMFIFTFWSMGNVRYSFDWFLKINNFFLSYSFPFATGWTEAWYNMIAVAKPHDVEVADGTGEEKNKTVWRK